MIHADEDPRRSLPIVVVDSDASMREALSRILRHEGFDVLEAEDGATAVALCLAERVGLVLLESVLPGITGDCVLGELRHRLGHYAPPVILVTASEREAARSAELGAAAAFLKPFQVEPLLDAVGVLCRRGRTRMASRTERFELDHHPTPSLFQPELAEARYSG